MLYYIFKLVSYLVRGDSFLHLTELFFISLFLHFFIVFYSLYSLIEIFLFHNLQGSKLNIKKQNLYKQWR